jgi:hypothetical protein
MLVAQSIPDSFIHHTFKPQTHKNPTTLLDIRSLIHLTNSHVWIVILQLWHLPIFVTWMSTNNFFNKTYDVATPLWPSVRMKLTLPKLGTWSPPGLPKIQSLISGVKTPRIGAFLISLERSWSVDVQNGLAWVIWTFAAQVMGKRKAGSQTGNLAPDH